MGATHCTELGLHAGKASSGLGEEVVPGGHHSPAWDNGGAALVLCASDSPRVTRD